MPGKTRNKVSAQEREPLVKVTFKCFVETNGHRKEERAKPKQSQQMILEKIVK